MGGIKKNHLKLLIKKFRAVQTWQFFLIFLLLLFLSATCLRLDHIRMTRLRDAVLSADESGDDEALAAALNKLQAFTRSHIVVNLVESNGTQRLEFGTGVFYLKQSYLRATATILDTAAAQEIDDSNPNGNIYAAASAVCRPRAIANGWAWNSPGYIACFSEELAKYPASARAEASVTVSLPSTELYRREFASPIWAPCFSGTVILLTAILGVVIFIRFLIWGVLEITLNFTKIS